MAKHAAAKHSGIQSAVYVFAVYRISNSYDCIFWICILHVTKACFTAGFADGAHAGAALYEGWCTGEDSQISCPLGHSAEEQSKRA